MSNEVMLAGKIEVPAYLAALMATDPTLAAINEEAMGGIKVGVSYPMITTKQGRFFFKEDGELTPINALEIDLVVIAAKPVLEKAYYIEKYDPSSNADVKAPDCYSRNGSVPDPSCSHKQNATCQGCPMNEFGSGTDQQGRPAKGKACSDNKLIAVFINGKIYGMKIPPNSLKPFSLFVKTLSQNGLFLPTIITRIGFAVSDTPMFAFKYIGVLNEQQALKVIELRESEVCKEIVAVEAPKEVAPAQTPVQQTPVQQTPVQQTQAQQTQAQQTQAQQTTISVDPFAGSMNTQAAQPDPFAGSMNTQAAQPDPFAGSMNTQTQAAPPQFNAVIETQATPVQPVQPVQQAAPTSTSAVSDDAVRNSLGLDL